MLKDIVAGSSLTGLTSGTEEISIEDGQIVTRTLTVLTQTISPAQLEQELAGLRDKLATVLSHIARLEAVRAGYDAARIAAAPKEI